MFECLRVCVNSIVLQLKTFTKTLNKIFSSPKLHFKINKLYIRMDMYVFTVCKKDFNQLSFLFLKNMLYISFSFFILVHDFLMPPHK